MQNDIANVGNEYIQPMADYFSEMLSNINTRVNQNRQEMKTLAERVQLGEPPADSNSETPAE